MKKAMKAEVREPVVSHSELITTIRAVVFVQDATVECYLMFMYGPGTDYANVYLTLEDKPEALHAYDFFNTLFKLKSFEMSGIKKLHKAKTKLEANWKIKKEKFKELLVEIRTKLGDEWCNAFSLVYPRIGSE